jgi:predicted DNA-binding transcriptional regulator AlpA
VEPRVLRPREAATLLNISRRTLDALRLKGDGPAFVRVTPGLIGYRPVDLAAWIEARRHEPRSSRPSRAS